MRIRARRSLRPQTLSEFIGQPKVCSNLKVFIEAARGRREALDHVLFAGPPGPRQDDARPDRGARAWRQFPRDLGPGDRQGRRPCRAPHQSRRPRRAVHRRDPPARPRRSRKSSIRRWRTSSSTSSSARDRRRARCASTCRRFTLIGATTRTGLLTTPLRERFGIPHQARVLRRRRSSRRSCGAARGCSACR